MWYFYQEKQPSVNSEKATVRVFMAPRFNEVGQRFSLDEQTRQFFAMDSFVVHCNETKIEINQRIITSIKKCCFLIFINIHNSKLRENCSHSKFLIIKFKFKLEVGKLDGFSTKL